MVQIGNIVERCADIRMFGTESLFRERKTLLEERLGFGVSALGPIKRSKVIERPTESRMFRS